MHFLQGAGGASLSMLLDSMEKQFPGEGAAIGAGLLAGGEPSVTAIQGFALLDLARQAAGLERPLDAPAFAAAFKAFLDAYGHRGPYETYLRNPRWDEAPELVLAQLPALAEIDAAALRERQRGAAAAAWQRIRRDLPWWRRPLLASVVLAANRECNQREAARSGLISMLAAGRRIWLAIAGQMVETGSAIMTGRCVSHASSAVCDCTDMSSLPPNAPPFGTSSTASRSSSMPRNAATCRRSSKMPWPCE